MENDINKKISGILKKIVKQYNSLNEFSRATGISSAYISKLINLKYANPPKPSTLQKIADASRGITTYDELMQVCGYTTNFTGLFGMNLNDNEIDILTEMLLDYKMFLDTKNSFDKFNEEKYLKNLSDNSKDKIINAFRINSLNIMLNENNDVNNNCFKFVCEDDAMYPLLDIDDIAIIYKTDLIEDNVSSYKGTYLIDLEGQNTIRRIILDEANSCYQLTAMNSYCKTIYISKDEIYDKIKILGKVVKSENTSAFK